MYRRASSLPPSQEDNWEAEPGEREAEPGEGEADMLEAVRSPQHSEQVSVLSQTLCLGLRGGALRGQRVKDSEVG